MYSSSAFHTAVTSVMKKKKIIKAKFDQRKYSRTKLNSSLSDTLQQHQEGINVRLYLGLIQNKLKSVELNKIFLLSVTVQRILKIDIKKKKDQKLQKIVLGAIQKFQQSSSDTTGSDRQNLKSLVIQSLHRDFLFFFNDNFSF